METDEENEVDATTVFVQAATNLTKVTSLDGILERFGYSKDDRINRRELVLMYKAVEKEMESEIFRLANTAYYDEAKEMRARLTRLRAEFDHLQTNGVAVTHLDQATNMEKATKELKRQVKTKHTSQVEAVQKRCEDLIADQNHFHEIEWENLELAISKIHRPPMKYSKRLIELMKAEHELIKLQQYEDARKVRRMIDRILPGEESRFNAAFDAMIELKRTRLRQRQEVEKLQLEEKTKAITWTDIRARELESNTQEQRIRNHEKDMYHSHLAESRLRPEVSVKPSHLWIKRPGYEKTAASLRGIQLLGTLQGKKEDQKIFADTLVDKHTFYEPLLDTVTVHSRLGSTL